MCDCPRTMDEDERARVIAFLAAGSTPSATFRYLSTAYAEIGNVGAAFDMADFAEGIDRERRGRRSG